MRRRGTLGAAGLLLAIAVASPAAEVTCPGGLIFNSVAEQIFSDVPLRFLGARAVHFEYTADQAASLVTIEQCCGGTCTLSAAAGWASALVLGFSGLPQVGVLRPTTGCVYRARQNVCTGCTSATLWARCTPEP